MTGHDRQVRTRTLSRIVGPYLVIAAVSLFSRLHTLPSFFSEFMEDEPLVFVTGALTVIAGLAVLAAHHHWNSISAAIISLVGILAVAKGAALMIAPGFGAEATDIVISNPNIMLGAIGIDFALGLWLTFAGLRPRPRVTLPT